MIELAPKNPYTLTIRSPLIAAAGSLGYGVEYSRLLGFHSPKAEHGLGALVTRSTSLRPQKARPLPALHETAAGLMYTGWEHNPGLRILRERHAPNWASWDLPIIVSLIGSSPQEIAEAAAGLEGLEGVAGIELPLEPDETADGVSRLLRAVRRESMLPLIVKLPGQSAQLIELAKAAATSGADTLALVNGLPAQLPQSDGTLQAGRLCGPAIFPLALALVSAVCAAVEIPVIGIGGVRSASDVKAMLSAGASAVGLGTALLNDARRAAEIVGEL